MTTPRAAEIVWARIAAPAVLAALVAAGAWQTHRALPVALALTAIALAAAVVLAWRNATGWTLLAGLTVPAAAVVLACWGDPRNVGWFGLCVIIGWVALVTPPRTAVGSAVALGGVFALQLVAVSREPGWFTWSAGIVFTVATCIFARRQRLTLERLHAAQTELAERARTDERHRIAREMHDLVGHSLTVTLLHLGSARLALDDDLPAARASLAEAERAARNSLNDVRGTVALLRTTEPSATLPAPVADDITGLVETYRDAGALVVLDVRGDFDALAPNQSLAVYRIVQESLTNAVRHGDGSPITITIHNSAEVTQISVRNAVPVRAGRGDGSGVAAMRERAETLGGRLTAGPRTDGWLVEAVIPA
jgi:signal transduction histidine kinase